MRRGSIGLTLALVLAAALVVSPQATIVTNGGITLEYPSFPLTGAGLQSCEPWADPAGDTIELSGLPIGSKVTIVFTWASPYSGGPNYLPPVTYTGVSATSLSVPISYPMDTTLWPVFNATTNERAIAVAAFVRVESGGVIIKLSTKQWWIRCLPPPPPFQGCTPGFWKQEQHLDSWPAGVAPGDIFDAVFGVDASFDPNTLLDALDLGGGGEAALARHAVAALLNALNPDVNFAYSVADILAGVQNAYTTGDFETLKTQLDFANNAGCPLN